MRQHYGLWSVVYDSSGMLVLGLFYRSAISTDTWILDRPKESDAIVDNYQMLFYMISDPKSDIHDEMISSDYNHDLISVAITTHRGF